MCYTGWLSFQPLVFQGAEELDIGGGSRRRAKVEVAQMKEQLESQVGGQTALVIVHHHLT